MTAPDARLALADELLSLSDVEKSFGRIYNSNVMWRASTALRASQPGTVSREALEWLDTEIAKSSHTRRAVLDEVRDTLSALPVKEETKADAAELYFVLMGLMGYVLANFKQPDQWHQGGQPVVANARKALKKFASYEEVLFPADDRAEPDDYDPAYDEGITYAIRMLAQLTDSKDWQMKDGSENHNQDVCDTIMDVLKCAGLYDDETGKFAAPPSPDREAIVEECAKIADDFGREYVDDGIIVDVACDIAERIRALAPPSNAGEGGK